MRLPHATPTPMPLPRRMLLHIACILSLAWPALINGQPFYFPDTTAYVRSADIAAYIFSGKRVSTAWTEHYLAAIARPAVVTNKLAAPTAKPVVAARGNDLSYGSIMAGRSPYFGALLWIAYVVSLFWLFVIAQAAIAYAIMRICLRLSGLHDWRILAGTVAILSLLSTLPFYVGLLMPDLLAAFAMLAFALLAVDRGRLRRGERGFLVAIMVAAAVSHLTHIWIICAMAGTLLVIIGLRRADWRQSRGALLAAMIATVIGMGSVTITDLVVERQFGRAPQLVPLLTARFLADGPGTSFLRTHCPEAGFAICAYRDRRPLSAPAFLWATAPGEGIYLLASPAERAAMASQDKAFAWAVLKAYPLEQGWIILRNTGAQLVRFDSGLLNYRCGKNTPCGLSLPEVDRHRLVHSLGGRGLWPQHMLTVIHHGAAGLSVILLLAWAVSGRKGRALPAERDLMLWLVLIAVAMVINAGLGGAVSESQTRYQARIVWLLPFFAVLAAMLWRQRTAAVVRR